MIKVLQVFNKLNQGGIEHVVINLMKNMDLSKIEVHFAMMDGEKGVLDETVKKMGGHIHYFSSGEKSLRNIQKNLSSIIMNYGPFEVVHSHVYFFSGYILYVAKKNRIPIRIAHAHDTYKGETKSISRKAYESGMKFLINRYATYKLGVSRDACFHVFGKIDDNTYIVNNAIDISDYKIKESLRTNKRLELGIHSNEKVIINIGRFEDQKDHKYLIKLFNKLSLKDSDFKLLLIGSGSLKNQIVDEVKQKGLSKKVLFLENRDDVNLLLMASDIFVMPSKYEGLPIVLIEAQASGLPCVVSSNITKEAIIAHNVYSLKKDNINNWILKILALKDSPRVDNALLLKKSGFDIKKVALFVQKLYLSRTQEE